MKDLNTETTDVKKSPVRKKRSLEERKKRIEEKRKKKRVKQIKNAIALVMALCLIIGCAVIISNMMSKNEEFEKTNSGDFINEDDLINETEEMYKAVPYYIEENYERYIAFAEKYPEKVSEDVVWMVNANLDMPEYGYDIPVTEYEDFTVIVNKYYKVSDNYRPTDLTTVDEQQLRQPAAAAFIKMRNDALEDNYKIRAVAGYRTVEEQNTIYSGKLESDTPENVNRYCERPGYSEHHTGLAVDVIGSKPGTEEFVNTPEYSWVRDNCYKYGFIIRYTEENADVTGYDSEPWHLRYVGEDISKAMKEENILSYEEYFAKYLQ